MLGFLILLIFLLQVFDSQIFVQNVVEALVVLLHVSESFQHNVLWTLIHRKSIHIGRRFVHKVLIDWFHLMYVRPQSILLEFILWLFTHKWKPHLHELTRMWWRRRWGCRIHILDRSEILLVILNIRCKFLHIFGYLRLWVHCLLLFNEKLILILRRVPPSILLLLRQLLSLACAYLLLVFLDFPLNHLRWSLFRHLILLVKIFF